MYQKGYINEPVYSYDERTDYNGNSIWHCELDIDGVKKYFYADSSSKKKVKKDVAFGMVKYILEDNSPFVKENSYYEEDEWDD